VLNVTNYAGALGGRHSAAISKLFRRGQTDRAMTPDEYEAAAVAIRLCRTSLDRYAAELSETEAAYGR
jgi:hypothetical protein